MPPTRFIGLDIHKYYLVAVGVDRDQTLVFGPQRVTWDQFDGWMQRHLTLQDAVVVEVTTNTWDVYDALLPKVASVTVVHPQQGKAVVDAPVKTDRKAAQTLAELLAANYLKGIWVPPQEVRDLRMLTSQYKKMSRLATTAKNRLQAVLHRHRILVPAGFELFHPDLRPWWNLLHVSAVEKVRLQSDLAALEFAESQKKLFENALGEAAAKDERLPLLIQIPGMGLINGMTALAAIGDIRRFPDARQLVGYAGLGARVHDSGESRTMGKITKAGRRDLRSAMVQAANVAVQHHPFWKKELERLEPRLGRGRAIVMIARKLLIVVWHVLQKEVADQHADPRDVACSLFAQAYRIKVKNLPRKMSAKEYVRYELDRLGIGAELKEIPWGTKKVKLPPSKLNLTG
ncbi:MAG: IS110 family transposase [Anaerolineaceae bacterium]|nr:IS110 family transposase [Anaerolineaceae bacterium]